MRHRKECKYAGLELTAAYANDPECICMGYAAEPEFWEPPEDTEVVPQEIVERIIARSHELEEEGRVIPLGGRSWALSRAFSEAQRSQDLSMNADISRGMKIERAMQLAQVYALIAIAEALEHR